MIWQGILSQHQPARLENDIAFEHDLPRDRKMLEYGFRDDHVESFWLKILGQGMRIAYTVMRVSTSGASHWRGGRYRVGHRLPF